MKLFIFSASLIYLLGLKMTTKMEFRSPLNSRATTIENGIKSTSKKTEPAATGLHRMEPDSLIVNQPTSNSLTAPSAKKTQTKHSNSILE